MGGSGGGRPSSSVATGACPSYDLEKYYLRKVFGIAGTTKFSDGRRRHRTLNVRLPLELGSDRRETSATRVSEDLQISIVRRRTNFFWAKTFGIEKSDFRQFGQVLEDLRPNGRQNQLPRQILLQIDLFRGLSVRPKIAKFENFSYV